MTFSLPSNFPGGDDFETVINLSQQENTNVRGDLSPLEIDHDRPVEIRPGHLFPASPLSSNFGSLIYLFIFFISYS